VDEIVLDDKAVSNKPFATLVAWPTIPVERTKIEGGQARTG
jgi:hypothetical protein